MTKQSNFMAGITRCEEVIKQNGMFEAESQLDDVKKVTGASGDWIEGFNCGIKHFKMLAKNNISY